MSDQRPSESPPPAVDPAPVRSPTEARQAARGGRVIWVLIGGLVLIVIIYLVIGLFTTTARKPPPGIGVEKGTVGSPTIGQTPQPKAPGQ